MGLGSPGELPFRAMSGDNPKGCMARCTMKAPVSTPKGGRVDKTIARISRIKGASARDANKLRWRFQDISRLKAKIKRWEEGWLTRGKDVFEKPAHPGGLPREECKKWVDEQIKWARIAIYSHNLEIDKSITYWCSWRANPGVAPGSP